VDAVHVVRRKSIKFVQRRECAFSEFSKKKH
jgi:hypothetical protein